MRNLFNSSKNYFFYTLPFVLVLISLVLSFVNYTPNTWLSGWDTLHPEFNFPLNLSRVLTGVWRGEQGLGAIAAHSHMSELPRIIFLWISSLFLPISFLRYFFFFVSLIIGPLGVYFFLNRLLPFKSRYSKALSAFLGASYYLLNLGTLQHYYVPFEMFATQFMFLPWILLFLCLYIIEDKRKNLLVLALIAFLSAPQAYAATLFYSAIICILLFGTIYALLCDNKKLSLKRYFVAISAILAVNLFWILPNLYSIFNQSQIVENSRINSLFSPEAFLRNKEYGTFRDVVIHKNFLFSWREFNYSDKTFVDLLNEWTGYLSKSEVLASLYLGSFIVFIGIIFSVLSRNYLGIALLPVGLLAYFFLANENPPFGNIFAFFRDNFPVFSEAFRTPFTKFSIIFIFIFSYFFAYFWGQVFTALTKFKVLRILPLVLTIVSFLILIIPFKPAFEGNLVSQSMKVKIPNEYFQTFEWFNKSKTGKIAKLPVNTHWGWVYNSWGFQGAGFTYFGTKSPQLDRDFDRWSAENESFYNELSTAVYSKNQREFENVLEKYNIKYLLLDESVINAGGSEKILFIEEIKTLITNAKFIKASAKFGFLTIYEVTNSKELVFVPGFINKSETEMLYTSKDIVYSRHGDYLLEEGQLYPLANLDNRMGASYSIEKGRLIIKKNTKFNSGEILNIPDIVRSGSITVATWATQRENEIEFRLALQSPTLMDSKDDLYSAVIEQRDSIKTGKSNSSYLSVDNEIFDLELPILQDTYIGSFNILKKPVVDFRLFSDRQEKFQLLSIFQNERPRSCADPNVTFNPSDNEEGLEINGEDNSLCLGKAFTTKSDGLLKISFKSKGDVPPWYCLIQVGQERCINSHVPTNLIKDEKGDIYEFFTPVSKGELWLDFVVPEASKGKKLKLTDFSVMLFQEIAQKEYSILSNFAAYSKEESITLNKGNQIKASIPTSTASRENFAVKRGFPESFNCDVSNIGEVTKEYMGKSIKYTADNGGVSCDFFDYPDLPLSEGYILHMKGVNSKGRGLKVYVFDKLNGQLAAEKILSEGQFDEFILLSPREVEGRGYTVNVETRSFGALESENEIQTLEFIPVPVTWLSLINIGNTTSRINTVFIESTNYISSFLLKTKVNVDREEGVLVLSEGYEKGWIAFTGFKKLKHTRFNTWANAWVVPQGTHTAYIFYWPQLLEYLGFAGIFILVGSLLLHKRKTQK